MVQFYDPVVICKVCGDHGHSKVSCLYTKALDTANISPEDAMFWSFVHPADRPESLRGDWSDGEEGDWSDGEEEAELPVPAQLSSDSEEPDSSGEPDPESSDPESSDSESSESSDSGEASSVGDSG